MLLYKLSKPQRRRSELKDFIITVIQVIDLAGPQLSHGYGTKFVCV